MTIIKGNLWDELDSADVIFFTGNNTLNTQNGLVMGAGVAKEAKKRFPDLPSQLGLQLLKHPGDYLLIGTTVIHDGRKLRIGALQTKRHWRSPSPPELVKASIERLARYARTIPDQRIALNYPGIGLGGLKESDVLPLLQDLPDNVFIYQLP